MEEIGNPPYEGHWLCPKNPTTPHESNLQQEVARQNMGRVVDLMSVTYSVNDLKRQPSLGVFSQHYYLRG